MGFVLDISLRMTLAALAVALVLRILRVRAASVRHSAWTVVLGAMLLMPLLPSIVPPVAVPWPRQLAVAGAPAFASDTLWYDDSTPGVVRTVPPSGAEATIPIVKIAPLPPRQRISPFVLLGLYGAGVLLFFIHLLRGAIAVRAMKGRAAATEMAGVRESSEIAVPLTVGTLRPVVMLPAGWRTWPREKIDAVLAHERAHVDRRDPLVALAARVNRALFWFHPLAWWLERQLAVTAEHACDEAAVRLVSEPRRYAEILLEMADAVRLHRGRVVWQGVGVNGGGMLHGRIARVLGGVSSPPPTRARTAGALLACAAVILLVVACRQKPAELQPDPELSRQLAEEDARMKKFQTVQAMTVDDADALEQRLAANPQDFDTRERLSWYYQTSRTVPWEKKVPGLRRHALWLIEHAPEHDVGPPALSPRYDPEGFAAAKKLWEAHLARPDVSPFIVYRAARFFAPNDKAYAERLILRGLAMDPESAALEARMRPNVAGYQWRSQLADLYASAIFGSESMWGTYNDLRIRPEKLNDPFAAHVLETLETSTDARLLASVGSLLARPRGRLDDPTLQAAQTKSQQLGLSYLRRAVQLDPTLDSAKRAIFLATWRDNPSEIDRLAERAHVSYMRAEASEHQAALAEAANQSDEAKARREAASQALEQAKREAEDVLNRASGHAGDPAYSSAVMTAHQVLATLAVRDGDRDRAVQHLRDSVAVPPSDAVRYAASGAWARPVNYLLKAGERERVAAFLETLAPLVADREPHLDAARAIREGRMPRAYQHMVNREYNEKQNQGGSGVRTLR